MFLSCLYNVYSILVVLLNWFLILYVDSISIIFIHFPIWLIIYLFLQLQHNLSASAIASSFGKVNGSRKLSEYKVEDIAATLLRDFTYHIAQVISWSVMEVDLFHGIEKISPSGYKTLMWISWEQLLEILVSYLAYLKKKSEKESTSY